MSSSLIELDIISQLIIRTKKSQNIMGKATGQTGRKSIPPDEKQILLGKIATLKLEGNSIQSIADELSLSWGTADKYWNEVLISTGDVDPIQLLKERRLVTERLLNKSLKSYYAGEIPIKDVATAMEMADKFNGLTQYIDTLVTSAQLPPLLEIRVLPVQLELPPTNN